MRNRQQRPATRSDVADAVNTVPTPETTPRAQLATKAGKCTNCDKTAVLHSTGECSWCTPVATLEAEADNHLIEEIVRPNSTPRNCEREDCGALLSGAYEQAHHEFWHESRKEVVQHDGAQAAIPGLGQSTRTASKGQISAGGRNDVSLRGSKHYDAERLAELPLFAQRGRLF